MPSWDPTQYAQFASERARPCRDLIAAIAIDSPHSIVDLGCGPGNSASMLAERWPASAILGVDSSLEMLEAARASDTRASFEHAEITNWATQPGESDIVFSNAALHWVPDHAMLFPKLADRVRPHGALAVQMPADPLAPAHVIARKLAASDEWRRQFATEIREWNVQSADFYYDALFPHARRIDLWTAEYFHALPSVEAITEWYSGSGLRPYLDALKTLSARTEFLAQYTDRLRDAYTLRRNGTVLLPFKRLFIVAYR